jgi:hypothetical protein
MRAIAPLAVTAIFALAACSPSNDHRASTDLKDAGHSVDNAAAGVAHNGDVKNAEADFKRFGHDAAKDFRKLGAEAKVEAHKLAADTRSAAHGVTKPDHPDDHNT